jgi:hypothetical protein
VRRGAKPVETEPLGLPGHPQGPIADQPRAQQGGNLEVGVTLGQRKAVARVERPLALRVFPESRCGRSPIPTDCNRNSLPSVMSCIGEETS